MGIPAPAGVGAAGTPPPGDQANAVLTATFAAVGPSLPFAFRGPFDVIIYASVNTALTTTNGSGVATLASASGLAAGDAINSVNVPAGTTIGVLSGTTVTLAFPPGATNASVVTGTDSAAVFTGAAVTYSASIQLERSFDGGRTYVVCGIGGGGAQAIWSAGTPVSVIVGEPERQVLYRLNCTQYTSGMINYRLSTTGAAAESLALATPI